MLVRSLIEADKTKIKTLEAMYDYDVDLYGYVEGYNDGDSVAFGIFYEDKLLGALSLGYADVYHQELCDHPDYHRNAYLLSDLFVREEFRRKGVGHKLAKESIDLIREREGNLPIFAMVINDDLIQFFIELGFKVVDGYDGFVMKEKL